MSKYSYKDIHIDNLHPDAENFRFDPVKDEKDAIITMVREIPTKIYTLIKSILDNSGIDPSILPNVVPYEKGSKEYVVMEGNRRICALKIIKNISLIENTSEYQKINKLLNKYDLSKIPDKYFCTIYENKEDTYFWTYLRHAGELSGEGLVSWDTLAIDRFKIGTKQASANSSYYIINYLRNNTDYHIEYSKIGTTLSRIIDSSVGKQYYNIEIRDDKLVFNNDVNETIDKICLLIDKLKNKSINSRNTNTVNDIQNWIYRLDNEYKSTLAVKKHIEEDSVHTETIYQEEVDKNVSKSINTSKDEKGAYAKVDTIDSNFTKFDGDGQKTENTVQEFPKKVKTKKLFEDLAFSHINSNTYGGIIKLGNEIIKLSRASSGANYVTYPVATAMLLRAYIEQAFKYFLNNNGHWQILCNNRKNGDPSLGEILTYCRNNKKTLFSDKTQMRIFGMLFDSDSTIKDYLDLNIHQPNIVTITNIELNSFSNYGLSSFLNYLVQ